MVPIANKQKTQGHMSPTSTTEPPEVTFMDSFPATTTIPVKPSVTIMQPTLGEGSAVLHEIQQAILAATVAAQQSAAAECAAVLEGQTAAMVGAFNVWASQNFI